MLVESACRGIGDKAASLSCPRARPHGRPVYPRACGGPTSDRAFSSVSSSTVARSFTHTAGAY